MDLKEYIESEIKMTNLIFDESLKIEQREAIIYWSSRQKALNDVLKFLNEGISENDHRE